VTRQLRTSDCGDVGVWKRALCFGWNISGIIWSVSSYCSVSFESIRVDNTGRVWQRGERETRKALSKDEAGNNLKEKDEVAHCSK
jgi:hypothetical protein